MPRAMPDGRNAGREVRSAGRRAAGEPGLARLRHDLSGATLWDDRRTAVSRKEPAVRDRAARRSPPAAALGRVSHDEPRRPAAGAPARDPFRHPARHPVHDLVHDPVHDRVRDGAVTSHREHRESGVPVLAGPRVPGVPGVRSGTDVAARPRRAVASPSPRWAR